MAAKIIAKNHEVTTFELNGRKQFIVDQVKDKPSRADRLVFGAINTVGHDWADVYNNLDLTCDIDDELEKAIDKHTV